MLARVVSRALSLGLVFAGGAASATSPMASVIAKAPVAVGATVGTDAANISSALVSMGCSISDLKREAKHFEMLCAGQGGTWEIYVDATTGMVTKVESTAN